MKAAPFRVWLKGERGLSAGTVGSLISNCRRVERHEGDLDAPTTPTNWTACCST